MSTLDFDENDPTEDQTSVDLNSFSELDRQYVYDLIEVFEGVKGKKLNVLFNEGTKEHYIAYESYNDSYNITTDPNDPMVDWKTAIEHELSHFIFDTAMKSFKLYANKILVDVDSDLKTIAEKMLHDCYNILEDQRIESWFGKIRNGSRIRFDNMRTKFGIDPTHANAEIKDPNTALLLARFKREDLVKLTAWKESIDYIKEAEFLDPRGSIALTKKYFDNFIHPFIKKEKKRLTDPNNDPNKKQGKGKQGKGQSGSQQGSQSGKQSGSSSGSSGKQSAKGKTVIEVTIQNGGTLADLNADQVKELRDMQQTDRKKFDELVNQARENKKNQGKSKTSTSDPLKPLRDMIGKIPKTDHKDFQESNEVDIDLNDVDKTIKVSKENAEKILKDIMDKLTEIKNQKKDDYKKVMRRSFRVQDNTSNYPIKQTTIDHSLASKLSTIFNHIRAQRKQKLDTKGSNISFKEYVNAKHNSNTAVFKNEQRSKGLTVMILCDQSGSMHGDQCQLTADLLATFYKSIQNYRDVKILGRGFSGDSGHLVQCKIDNIKECGRMANTHSYTPTELAIIQAKKELDKINGKKFLIVFTDGMPNEAPVEDVNKYMHWLIDCEFKKNNIGSFGVLIGDEDEEMKKMFDDDFATCNDISEAKNEITKIFEKIVKEYLGN